MRQYWTAIAAALAVMATNASSLAQTPKGKDAPAGSERSAKPTAPGTPAASAPDRAQPSPERRRQSRGRLTLSQDDARFIYDAVPRGRRADIRIRMALGAEVPIRVDLQQFPSEILARVPIVGSFRFVVVENDVAIVDPADRSVVLVITR